MRLTLLVPAPLATISGGYGYDRRVIAELRAAGHTVDVLELAGRHPLPDATARQSARDAWAALPPDALPLIDGLGLPAFDGLIDDRPTLGLIHHPTSLEAGTPDADRAALAEIEARMFPALSGCIVTSDTTAETLAKDFAVAPGRIATVAPGTDPAPRSPGSGSPTCHILSVGALIPRKGHELLLRALARLFDLDWHLTIAGGTPDPVYAQTLTNLAEELKIIQRVRFVGTLTGDALETLWQNSDIFALATEYEGYGMVIAEALKRGLPVAITKGGAAGALVPDEAGIACDVGDLVTYSKALRRVIFDTELRADMAQAAFEAGQALPDWSTQGAEFAAAVIRLSEGKG
ncbi:MAG: glycosyltransferase family 4 protein [Acetobacteraceae bacterium]|nr:glycosyltransferase family 4 protein [Acetobacteraceae bacterium]